MASFEPLGNLQLKVSRAERESIFGMIPVEVASKIFSYMEFPDKKALRLVCPRWCLVINNTLKFNTAISNQTETWIRECAYDLGVLTIENWTNPSCMLNFKDIFSPSSQVYVIGPGNSSQNILSFLRWFCSTAESITFKNLAFSNVTTLNIISGLPCTHWPYLSTLVLNFGHAEETPKYANATASHCEVCIIVLNSMHILTLRNLHIIFEFGNTKSLLKRAGYVRKPWEEILMFIFKHSYTLRELSFLVSGGPTTAISFECSHLLYHLQDLNLVKFSLKFDAQNCNYGNRILGSGIHGLKELSIVRALLEQDHSETIPIRDFLIFQTNAIRTLVCEYFYFDCVWLDPLACLENLVIRTRQLRFIFRMPQLPHLCSFTLYVQEFDEDLISMLTESIVGHMPMLEEIELVVNMRHEPQSSEHIRASHIEELRQHLPNLRRLTVGEIYPEDRDGFSNVFSGCQGVSLIDETRPNFTSPYEPIPTIDCITISITPPV